MGSTAVNGRSPVIDAHVHVGLSGWHDFFGEEELLARMDATRQDKAVIMMHIQNFEFSPARFNYYGSNEYVAELQSRQPERFIGIGVINPWYQKNNQLSHESASQIQDAALDEIDRCLLDYGLHGVKLHPTVHQFDIADEVLMRPIFERLVELQKKLGRRLFNLIHGPYFDSIHNGPEQFAWAATNFPELTIAAGHAGFGPGGDRLVDLASSHSNLVLDFTHCPDVQIMAEAARQVDIRQLVSGSDEPNASFEWKMGIIRAGFPDADQRAMVLGGSLQAIIDAPII